MPRKIDFVTTIVIAINEFVIFSMVHENEVNPEDIQDDSIVDDGAMAADVVDVPEPDDIVDPLLEEEKPEDMEIDEGTHFMNGVAEIDAEYGGKDNW